MRKTQNLHLVYMGATAVVISGCAEEPKVPVSRDYYATAQECIVDWGVDECEDVRSSNSYNGGTGTNYHNYGFYGPYYDRTSGRVYRLDGSTYYNPRVSSPRYTTHGKSVLNYRVPESSLKYSGDGIYGSSAKAQARIASKGNFSAFSNGRSSSFGKAGFGTGRSFGG